MVLTGLGISHIPSFLVIDTLLPGMPDWQQIVKELPQMEALLSKLER